VEDLKRITADTVPLKGGEARQGECPTSLIEKENAVANNPFVSEEE
jgi:hypothetical protein